MDRSQFDFISTSYNDRIKVDAADLIDQSDRILIRGYTPNGDLATVSLIDGAIRVVNGRYPGVTRKAWDPSALIPIGHRVYPEYSDFEFCLLLKAKGFPIPFDSYPEDTE